MKTITKPTDKAQPFPVKRRISANVRQAINKYITSGMSKAGAAEEAGITPGHLYNQEMKPHVQEYIEETKDKFIQDVDALKAPYRSQSIEVARHLMHNAKSETVRMRAVEFFTPEAKSPAIAVQINTGKTGPNAAGQPSQGYEYLRPGQELVRIITPKQPDLVVGSGDVIQHDDNPQ